METNPGSDYYWCDQKQPKPNTISEFLSGPGYPYTTEEYHLMF